MGNLASRGPSLGLTRFGLNVFLILAFALNVTFKIYQTEQEEELGGTRKEEEKDKNMLYKFIHRGRYETVMNDAINSQFMYKAMASSSKFKRQNSAYNGLAMGLNPPRPLPPPAVSLHRDASWLLLMMLMMSPPPPSIRATAAPPFSLLPDRLTDRPTAGRRSIPHPSSR
ncbi:hypothetical protein NQZ68_001618 [Dissostichus eleginoides]|nr:hypothetical protein NQZ68_001618 [Dissostichus eleginoides]